MWNKEHHFPRRWLVVWGILLWALVWGTNGAHAQDQKWQERRTQHFAILYPDVPEARPAVEQYAQFVDGVYDELSAVFSYRTPPPVVLRIYPTMELYERVNPLAAQMPGVVAHAHTGRREISIALPQTVDQPPDQIVNNVRHELTHIIAADLSGDKLTTAFQEGIAQYLEHPSAELDTKMQLMQQVVAADRVLPWSELNRPGVAYADPRISYPQSYTMVAFLIKRNGFATFRTFLEQTKTSSGYRGALETAYNVSPDQLEREWRAQLDTFINGSYRERAVGAFDLSQAEALIARGEYELAAQQLDAALKTLNSAEQGPLAEQAQTLLKRARDGQRVNTLAKTAREALIRGDYAGAQRAAEEGQLLLNELGQPAQLQVMEQYSTLAAEGSAAQQQLREARGNLRTLRIAAARTALADAYRTFTRLGDTDNASAAQTTLLRIQRTETGLAVALVLLAALIIGWNIHRRVNERDHALPFS